MMNTMKTELLCVLLLCGAAFTLPRQVGVCNSRLCALPLQAAVLPGARQCTQKSQGRDGVRVERQRDEGHRAAKHTYTIPSVWMLGMQASGIRPRPIL